MNSGNGLGITRTEFGEDLVLNCRKPYLDISFREGMNSEIIEDFYQVLQREYPLYEINRPKLIKHAEIIIESPESELKFLIRGRNHGEKMRIFSLGETGEGLRFLQYYQAYSEGKVSEGVER